MIPTLGHGGAEKVLVNLVNNLNKDKYEVTVYSIFAAGVNKDFLNENIIYKYKFKKVFRGNTQVLKLFSPNFLYKWFIKEDYDLAVSYLEGPANRIIAGCNNPKTKKISWIHTELPDERTATIGFKDIKEASYYFNCFDKIAVVSETAKESFQKWYPNIHNIRVIYNILEVAKIKNSSNETVEEEFDSSSINLCSVGKISKNKGFERLLEVHKRLLDEGFPHNIYILGIGEDQPLLEKRILELKVENSFKFLGYKKNPYKYIAKSDLYVCSSYREGFSTSVSEALILSIPVVSTKVSGANELLGYNNEYGIVTENSVEGLYKGIKEMLSAPEKLNYYKKQAEIRGSFFSTEDGIKKTESFIDEILN